MEDEHAETRCRTEHRGPRPATFLPSPRTHAISPDVPKKQVGKELLLAALAAMKKERQELDEQIANVEAVVAKSGMATRGPGRPRGSKNKGGGAKPTKRRKPRWSRATRQAAAARMKKYWAERRRKEKKKTKKKREPSPQRKLP